PRREVPDPRKLLVEVRKTEARHRGQESRIGIGPLRHEITITNPELEVVRMPGPEAECLSNEEAKQQEAGRGRQELESVPAHQPTTGQAAGASGRRLRSTIERRWESNSNGPARLRKAKASMGERLQCPVVEAPPHRFNHIDDRTRRRIGSGKAARELNPIISFELLDQTPEGSREESSVSVYED